jgi:phosphatidylglycerol lysyltransferase
MQHDARPTEPLPLPSAGLFSRFRQRAGGRLALVWTLLFFALLAVFLFRERGDLRDTTAVIRRARVEWLFVGAAIQALIVSAFALVLGLLLRRLGYRPGWWMVLQAYFRLFIVGAVTPVSGPASTVACVRFMSQRGVRADDGLLTVALYSVLGYGSFALFLIPVLIFLQVQHHLSRLFLLGAGVLILITVLFAGLSTLLLRESGAPAWLLRRVPRRARDFADQARSQRIRARDLGWPLATSFAIELLGVALLYCCLRAIGETPTLATALTAYAVATTFTIVSPLFSGLGLVELGMAVTLREFGIPGQSALAATLLFRAVELWLPLLVGVSLQLAGQRDVRRTVSKVPAALTFVTGLLAVLSVLAPTLPQRLNRFGTYSPFSFPSLSRSFVVVAGFFLIFLSFSLWRRKRVAWLAAVVLLVILIPAHLLKHHDQVIALVAMLNLGLLLLTYRDYTVRSDVPTLAQGFIRFGLSLLFALLYGTLGFFLIDQRAFGMDFTLREAATRTLRAFLNLGDADLVAHTRYARWFLDSLSLIGIVAASYAVFSLMRPIVWRRTVHEREREHARALIQAHGDSALDFFKYAADKYFFFASNDRAVVSYGLWRATAVALGDPVAASDADFDLVLREFLDFCDTNDWRVAFHQASPHRLPAYRAAGLSALKVGEDAIIDLSSFTLAGGAMKSLRNNANRLERAGFRVVLHPAPLSPDLLGQLRHVSDEWLRLGGHRERRFTLGRFDENYLRDCAVFAVEDAAGHVVAFANLVPDGAPGEATIDLMRRLPEPDGAMDYLFVRIFERLRDEGYQRFSLGMAPFANVGTDPTASFPERVMGELYEHVNRIFSYKGLREYKEKFHPTWEPRYLVYTSELALPIVTLALVRLTE